MKKLSFHILTSLIILCGVTTAGCQFQDFTKSTSEPTVTHLVAHEVNPDDLTDGKSGDHFDLYLTANAARAEISETITVDGLSPNTSTMYLFSDLTARQEYMVPYPNPLTAAEIAELPSDHPFKQGKSIITSLAMDKRAHGKPNQSFGALILDPILTVPTDQFITTATDPYVIADHYTDTMYGETPLERRTTIDPHTNLPTQVQLIDTASGNSVETFAIDQYEMMTPSELAKDFFTLEGWQHDLPAGDYTVIEDDLN